MLRRSTRLSIAVLTAVLVTATACDSDTTGEPTASSGSASAQSSLAFPSESVPAGVEKDSVLDLNSTKDMTGVVTTVTFADSPYAAHLPDICTLIPDSAMKQLGVDSKDRGFDGTQLVTQACSMQNLKNGNTTYSVTVNFLTNNIREVTNPSRTITIGTKIAVSSQIVGSTIKLQPSGPDDETFRYECGTAWGTFFGAIVVNYRSTALEDVDSCNRSIESARIIAPYMPKSPSQMRPAP